MRQNSEIIKNFLECMIKIGGKISSKNFIILSLSNMVEEQKKRYIFMHYISINNPIIIDPKMNKFDKKNIVKPINEIFDYLFFPESKKMFKETIDKNEFNEFNKFGFNMI